MYRRFPNVPRSRDRSTKNLHQYTDRRDTICSSVFGRKWLRHASQIYLSLLFRSCSKSACDIYSHSKNSRSKIFTRLFNRQQLDRDCLIQKFAQLILRKPEVQLKDSLSYKENVSYFYRRTKFADFRDYYISDLIFVSSNIRVVVC